MALKIRHYETEWGGIWTGDVPDHVKIIREIPEEEYKEIQAARIREYLPKGADAWTITMHVSRSGMSRHIRVYAIHNNEPVNMSRMCAQAMGYRYLADDDSLFVSGCGMDMGFAVVYSLSYTLYQDGYAIKQRWM